MAQGCDLNKVCAALGPHLRGHVQDQGRLCEYVVEYIGWYHKDREVVSDWGDALNGKAKDRLGVAARGMNRALKYIPTCGQRRMEMLYDAYDRGSDGQDSSEAILTGPWDILDRDLEGLKRLAGYCEMLSEINIPDEDRPHSPARSNSEVLLLARVGHRARELGVLDRLGKHRNSLFHRISKEVLELADLKLEKVDRYVVAAVSYLQEGSSEIR